MNALARLVAHDRLERVLAHTDYVLKEIRRTDRAGALSGDLALIWCRHLGPVERCLLLATAAQAAESEDLDALLVAAQRDREPPRRFTGLYRRHRPPPLTPVQKRRAAALQFDDNNPRAILAAAWAGASDKDRHDLVSRATGRVDA